MPTESENNETIFIQRIVHLMMLELIEKKWGTGNIQLIVKNGKVVNVKKMVEQVIQLDPDSLTSRE